MRSRQDGAINLRILKPSRRKPVAGDIFVLSVEPGKYLFGRVMRHDFQLGFWPHCNLIYVYQNESDRSDKIPDLDWRNLLIPPQIVNRQPWLKGYFMTVANIPLREEDFLPQHCFVDIRGYYFDENGKRLSKRIEPCGVYGLGSYGSVNEDISEALGLQV